MASARARLGAARRGIIKRKKTTDLVTGALSAIGTVAAFGAGQAKKADTAWGEYEAGYKELGGEGFERPKFGQKGYFKGPKGEVRIGEQMYDRGQIKKAGAFLGSDAAAILDPEQRQQYLGRTAPGTLVTGEHLEDWLQSDEYKDTLSTKAVGTAGQKVEDGKAGMYADGQWVGSASEPTLTPTARKVPASIQKRRDDYQDALIQFPEGQNFPPAPSYKQMAENNPLTITPLYDDAPPDLGTQNIKKIDPQETSQSFLQNITRGFKQKISDIGVNKWQKSEKERIESEKREIWGPSYKERKTEYEKNNPNINVPSAEELGFSPYSFAKGGDFITNGPQKIIVGDNASGRERVTIKPLPSKKDAEFGRYGDDSMKIIDGQPAHIDSSIKGDMSPEDIKKYGSGTINPITGKKEYFLPALPALIAAAPLVTAGLAVGSSLYKGFSAMGNKADIETGKTAAGDIYQEQVQMAGQQKATGLEQIKSQYTTGQEELALGTQMQTADIQTGGAFQQSQANLVSGSVKSKMDEKMKNLMAQHATTAKKQADTKKYAEAQEIYRLQEKEPSAKDLLQGTLTELESQPTTFLEGMFG